MKPETIAMEIASIRKGKRAMRTHVNIRNLKLGLWVGGLRRHRAAKKGEKGHARKRAHHHLKPRQKETKTKPTTPANLQQQSTPTQKTVFAPTFRARDGYKLDFEGIATLPEETIDSGELELSTPTQK
jgi:hypothetical protein